MYLEHCVCHLREQSNVNKTHEVSLFNPLASLVRYRCSTYGVLLAVLHTVQDLQPYDGVRCCVNEYNNGLHSIWEKGRLLAVALNREPLNSQGITNLCVGTIGIIIVYCALYCQINFCIKKNWRMNYNDPKTIDNLVQFVAVDLLNKFGCGIRMRNRYHARVVCCIQPIVVCLLWVSKCIGYTLLAY